MAAPDPNIGRVLGDYKLLKMLGRGGMGIVYKARQLSLDRSVAIKILRSEIAENENLVKRFLREGKVLAKLEHSNIVRVHQVGRDRDTYYLAMEYVRGKTLREVLKEDGRLKVNRAVDIARQVAEALASAHKQDIIHRDIKPGNIMIDRKGRVRVMDFGLAKVMSEISSGLTSTGTILGSPRYMAPEQWRGDPATPQTDIYGLGTVLYEMLAGEPPFRGETPQSLMHEILAGDFPAPSYKNPNVITALDTIVLDMTAKDPAKRYVSAESLAKEMRNWLSMETDKIDEVVGSTRTEDDFIAGIEAKVANIQVSPPFTKVSRTLAPAAHSASPQERTRDLAYAAFQSVLFVTLMGVFFCLPVVWIFTVRLMLDYRRYPITADFQPLVTVLISIENMLFCILGISIVVMLVAFVTGNKFRKSLTHLSFWLALLTATSYFGGNCVRLFQHQG